MAEAGEASSGNDMVDLLGLFRVLWRRKLLIAAVVALGTVGAYLYGKNLTPTYTAKAAVLIDPQQTQIIELKAMLSGMSTDGAGLGTQIKLIQSRTFLARVMDELGLFEDPEFNPALRPKDDPPIKISLTEPFRKLMALIPHGLADGRGPVRGAGDGAGERGAPARPRDGDRPVRQRARGHHRRRHLPDHHQLHGAQRRPSRRRSPTASPRSMSTTS